MLKQAAFGRGNAAVSAKPRSGLVRRVPSAISASERLPQTVAGAFGKTAVKSSVSNVDRLNTLEKELQAMFAEGAPVPKAKVVSQYRKKIKELREVLMVDLAGMASLGASSSPTQSASPTVMNFAAISEAEKARQAMAAMDGRVGGEVQVTDGEILEIQRLEEENRMLRQRANTALARLQMLEELKQQAGSS
mmetsp:Transcript_24830/g.63929  ORF Transcript_24830/g.63929 Transcript_24830/m.63929 type:complete len:192 (-) Transcript_24830:255-830(-)|eukprot:jgi/Tetstr1/421619/TSEL_012560.t1